MLSLLSSPAYSSAEGYNWRENQANEPDEQPQGLGEKPWRFGFEYWVG